MHDPARLAPWTGPDTPIADYRDLTQAIAALLAGETDPIANLANAASAIFHSLPGLNWAGFYILRGEELVLGPFQGRPACVRIALGQGVCGSAAREGRSVLVPDVNEFPVTSPATWLPAPNSSYLYGRMAGFAACSTWTVP